MCRASKRDFDIFSFILGLGVTCLTIGIGLIVYSFTIQISRADAINDCYVKAGHWDVKANVCEARK